MSARPPCAGLPRFTASKECRLCTTPDITARTGSEPTRCTTCCRPSPASRVSDPHGAAREGDQDHNNMHPFLKSVAMNIPAFRAHMRRVEALCAQLDRVSSASSTVSAQRDQIARDFENVSAERDRVAEERDRIAAERDRVAKERDRAAE